MIYVLDMEEIGKACAKWVADKNQLSGKCTVVIVSEVVDGKIKSMEAKITIYGEEK